jgi:WD40 repeat protein
MVLPGQYVQPCCSTRRFTPKLCHINVPDSTCSFPLFTILRTFMAKLDYQEHYQRLAHASSINAIALSPNGRRFVTASEDSTVIVWSTGSADQLYHIKAHSPIHSLAWLTNSHGFIFGCRNGLLASVDMLEVCPSCIMRFRAYSN